MSISEKTIENQFGKIVRKFKLLHYNWELDCFGYIVETSTRSQTTHKLILTNHSKPYIADISELKTKLHEYKDAISEIIDATIFLEKHTS